MTVKDSYDLFLKNFSISKDDFYRFGLTSTIFVGHDIAKDEWERLKDKIFKGEKVYIRGYGRDASGTDAYKRFYVDLLGNRQVEKDPTNNSNPQRIVETLTRQRRNRTILNYQVSHIWGHTKNPFLFEAPWNICLVPKMYDPFTGHETKGDWSQEYQKFFFQLAFDKYRDLIQDYNQIVDKLDLGNILCTFLDKQVSWDDKKKRQFKKDVESEFVKITQI